MMSALKIKPIMLADLLTGIFTVPAEANCVVTGLCLDSRKLNSGDIFIVLNSLSNSNHDASTFIDMAMSKGAQAVLWETDADIAGIEPITKLGWRTTSLAKKIPLLAIAGLSKKLGMIADCFYGEPSKDLSITGITGTNGKTSVSQYLAQCLGEDCGVMGTLGAGLVGELTQTGFTTPDALHCHRWLAEMREQKVHEISMEVSSHALQQGRVNAIRFDSAVFTNLSRDHLDYHGDMQSYALAKAGLFSMPGLKLAVINIDDEYGRELVAGLGKNINLIRYGLDEQQQPEVFAQNLKQDIQGLSMQVQSPWGSAELRVPLLGRFNASNVLAVLAVLGQKDLPLKQIISRLEKLQPVAGRMQCLGGSELPLVVVDYAHTPDALEQALKAVREHVNGQCYCVFGCGGDRDQGKRALMGEMAARLADQIILTNDNPRTENPQKILDDIQQGINSEKPVTLESDRAAAIAFAITQADAGDVVLIAGKGHEAYQLINDKKWPFSDVTEAEKQLRIKAGEV
ncbi:UDP-N-acetylmuramoylalanyl-D-glutamate--2,6-diaminopimelate ligase [hydrothermal vent metagenome]|uniref:UDP-N-acetylmuramoylalanyl-D-glutamate--2,6-diaminopimelate ligase n=1 Tax=hydrothermal vent metagenome TaxID=652676 RepID=A0A3B1BLY2_9ZZZZ